MNELNDKVIVGVFTPKYCVANATNFDKMKEHAREIGFPFAEVGDDDFSCLLNFDYSFLKENSQKDLFENFYNSKLFFKLCNSVEPYLSNGVFHLTHHFNDVSELEKTSLHIDYSKPIHILEIAHRMKNAKMTDSEFSYEGFFKQYCKNLEKVGNSYVISGDDVRDIFNSFRFYEKDYRYMESSLNNFEKKPSRFDRLVFNFGKKD